MFETQAQHALRESGFATIGIVYQLSTVSCHDHGPIGYSLKLTVANSNEDFQMEGHIASAIRGDRLIIRSAKQSDLETPRANTQATTINPAISLRLHR